jgi:peptidyl-dipeptidase A
MRLILSSAASLLALSLVACQETPETQAETVTTTVEAVPSVETPTQKPATIQEAKEFLETAEKDIELLGEHAARVYWVNANFITDDTNWLAAKIGEEGALLSTRLANEAKRFNDLTLPADMRRKMDMLKRGSNFPAPERPGAAKKLSEIMTTLNSAYGTGKFEYKGEMITLGQASDIIAKSDNPEELQAVWEGWRTVSPQMKNDYSEMVKIINEGAQELGYADAGALWRGGYDMDADEFVKETDRIWGQVKPLYDQLHCAVRAGLNEKYGDEVVPLDQPMRADILGNMWGQSWGNVYDVVAPEGAAPGVDTTKLLEENGYDALKMVKTAETFFTSMGFEPLPDSFYQRSLITKPADREVVCHASAWNIDWKDDIRIKMCTKVNAEDFSTVHHELGHNFYQRAYKDQAVFYRDGANDGFHEAIGDMIALSITPEYLVQIGLLDEADLPGSDADLALLMRQAMDKVAFLPFGLMVDQWRWKVFNGEYSPSEYNDGWWELRKKYQGLRAPSSRPADAFDPGAKYHIPGNTPYMRYFLAHILQFQFHKAACDAVGFEGPLHRCSVYGNKEVGDKFQAMLEMGSSKPWPDALEAFTGTREMDGSAILEYFAPLQAYLEEQNKDRTCGW